MPNTYTLIASNTVGSGGAASVTFSSIPQTGYTDLKLVCSSRSLVADAADGYKIEINGDTTSGNYVGRRLYGNGASASSDVQSNTNIPMANGNNATANTFGTLELYILNYTSANYKSISIDGANETNAGTAYAALSAWIWNSTAAITSINLKSATANNFMQYSTFYLYGIKNS